MVQRQPFGRRIFRERQVGAGGVVDDLNGGFVDVQRMDDLQLGPGRRLRLRHGVPAGNPEEFLDFQAHPTGLAVLFLLVGGTFGGQWERGRFARLDLVPGRGRFPSHRGRTRLFVAAAAAGNVVRRLLVLFDLFAVLGQQLPVGDRHVVGPELVVRERTAGAVLTVNAELRRAPDQRGRRWRFWGLALDAPGTLRRAVAGDRSLKFNINRTNQYTTINTDQNIFL